MHFSPPKIKVFKKGLKVRLKIVKNIFLKMWKRLSPFDKNMDVSYGFSSGKHPAQAC